MDLSLISTKNFPNTRRFVHENLFFSRQVSFSQKKLKLGQNRARTFWRHALNLEFELNKFPRFVNCHDNLARCRLNQTRLVKRSFEGFRGGQTSQSQSSKELSLEWFDLEKWNLQSGPVARIYQVSLLEKYQEFSCASNWRPFFSDTFFHLEKLILARNWRKITNFSCENRKVPRVPRLISPDLQCW